MSKTQPHVVIQSAWVNNQQQNRVIVYLILCLCWFQVLSDHRSDIPSALEESVSENLEKKWLERKKQYQLESKKKDHTLSLFMRYLGDMRHEVNLLNEELKKYETRETADVSTQTNVTNEEVKTRGNAEKKCKKLLKKEKRLKKERYFLEKISVNQKSLIDSLFKERNSLINKSDYLDQIIFKQCSSWSNKQQQALDLQASNFVLQKEASALKSRLHNLSFENMSLEDVCSVQYSPNRFV